MYPQAETAQGRRDSLDPDTFKYTITTREINFLRRPIEAGAGAAAGHASRHPPDVSFSCAA